MELDKTHIYRHNLLYSCVDKVQRSNEQFVEDHALGYVLSGQTNIILADGVKIFKAGTIGVVRRNQLIKSLKVPPPGGVFQSINITFSQGLLRKYSAEHEITSTGKYTGEGFQILEHDPFLKGFFESLLPYFEQPDRMDAKMTELKTIEAIELLLKTVPGIKDLLFDFQEPYKIDLEAFMLQHYKYNVTLDRFAKLTGRSKAGFKRDFEKIFNASPGHWLQQKRLEEAYYLISKKGIKPSAAYLDVGFENLSHFSFLFKKTYGISPSLAGEHG